MNPQKRVLRFCSGGASYVVLVSKPRDCALELDHMAFVIAARQYRACLVYCRLQSIHSNRFHEVVHGIDFKSADRMFLVRGHEDHSGCLIRLELVH